MTVFSFGEDDPQNPLARGGADEVARIPFGAVELDRDGRIIAYNDTEPDSAAAAGRASLLGRSFFDEIMHLPSASVVGEEFRKGVAGGDLNTVFDCAISRLPYKVRIHLKVSPILGTFWVFVKKLARER